MPIEIRHNEPSTHDHGGARFTTDATPGSRYISASAEKSLHSRRPICIYINSDDFRTTLSLSVDETEALIACLAHAVSLRHQADAAKAA